MTSIDDLNEESSMLTVKKFNELLTKQYLIACYLSTHPNHGTVIKNPPPRCIRLDLTIYKPDITHLTPTMVDLRSVREAQDSLHQTTVTTAKNQLSHNRVINRHPPPVSDTERRLPRVTRTNLAQLRSGWSNTLNSYRARIIPGTSDSCPSCNKAPHDTVNIFNCPAKPTALQPIDLWLNPIITAGFLGLPTTCHHTTYIHNFNELYSPLLHSIYTEKYRHITILAKLIFLTFHIQGEASGDYNRSATTTITIKTHCKPPATKTNGDIIPNYLPNMNNYKEIEENFEFNVHRSHRNT